MIGLDAARYAAANGRVRGLYSRLLSESHWRDLIGAPDLAATLSLLRTTIYSDVIASAEQRGLTLVRLERRLLGKAALNCRHAMAFTSGGTHTLILVWWQHFELENLKAVFRGVEQGMEPEEIRRFLIPLGEYSTLPWETLLNERSISNLVDDLNKTHYINPLRVAWPAYQREQAVFPLEVALDIRYYRDLAAAIKHLKGDDREQAQRLLGTWLDILNILWAYRYRVYYGLSAEEIVNYTLWHTFRTNIGLVREIALGADPRDVLARVWGGSTLDLSPLNAYQDQLQMMPALEMLLQRYWRRLARRALEGYPLRLGSILGYLVLQELEIKDLITLLEGKGMNWSPERIHEHLIRSRD